MHNFRWITHLDTFPALPRLHKLAPTGWKPVEARGETMNPMIGLGASLPLRGHDSVTRENWLDDLPVRELPTLAEWPSMKRLLEAARRAIMAEPIAKTLLAGDLARAMISRLDPGSTIFWHVDDGPYHARTARFHVPLVTNPGCQMYSGPEMVHMPQGSLWWFNNHARHSAANWGQRYRLHLIFEMYLARAADDDPGDV